MGINKVSKLQFSPDDAFLSFLEGRTLKLQGFPPSILLNTLLRVLPANESYIFLVLLILPTQKQFKNY